MGALHLARSLSGEAGVPRSSPKDAVIVTSW